MKHYDLLLSFGCSFTEGGGLNDPRYHQYIHSNITDKQKLNQYMTDHSYPSYLAKLLGCNFVNYGTSCAGNEFIFKSVYDKCKNIDPSKSVLVTVQTSILSRMLITSADDKDISYNINSDEHPIDYIGNYYRTYIQRFYNEYREFDKLIMNVDLLQTWLRTKNIDFAFIAWDSIDSDIPKEYFLHCGIDTGSFDKFIKFKKKFIADLPNTPIVDFHATERGNELIAHEIFNYLRKKYD
jgi:hypothetical protein